MLYLDENGGSSSRLSHFERRRGIAIERFVAEEVRVINQTYKEVKVANGLAKTRWDGAKEML
jgi:hypothetical protein